MSGAVPRLPADFQPPPPFNWTAAIGCAALLFGVAIWAAASVGAFA